jgi:SRSO17 transposase
VKKGRRSAGVQRQYTGTSGKIDNCQLGVFVAYATHRGHALIDRELYLPTAWTNDPDRCAAAGIPAETEFATKPELVVRMLERVDAAGALRGWFAYRPGSFRLAMGEAGGCGLAVMLVVMPSSSR